jgi:hypothetical protein
LVSCEAGRLVAQGGHIRKHWFWARQST